MQVYRNWLVLLIAACAVALWSAAARADGVVGTWLTEGGKSRVEIADCGDTLCGSIVWLAEPLDDSGEAKTDRNNPDESLRERRIVGLQLLRGFIAADEENVWSDGTIYNPEDGETYSCTLTLQDDGTLKVRGYVGLPLFGKTQIWNRAS
jgi:uncharacterized protein (DUF2147 family)